MKGLDRFSRIENGVLKFIACFCVFGVPVLSIFVVDALFLRELEPIIRYPLLLVSTVILSIIIFALGFMIEGFFESIRNVLGLKPFSEIDKEAEHQLLELEVRKEEGKYDWFVALDASEQRYKIYLFQERQLNELKTISTIVIIILSALAGLGLGYVLKDLF